jgi:catechol 2,3-dioxygenase-like lactoylglutathione lyase family enzyme
MTSGLRALQIDHVEFFVPDRFEAATWYRDVLGLEIIESYRFWSDDPRGPLMISSDGGRTKLALFTGPPQYGRETAGFYLVAFRVEGPAFLAFLNRLPALGLRNYRGETLTSRSFSDHELAFSVYFVDPWGHRLEVTTYDHDTVRLAAILPEP